MTCSRCTAPAPVHKYPVGSSAVYLCTRCWASVTHRNFNDTPPINPSQKLLPGFTAVQPCLL